MARRTGRSQTDQNTNAEAPAEAPTQEEAVTAVTDEAPVETPEDNQTDEQPSEAATEDAPKAEEKPVDLTAFNAETQACYVHRSAPCYALAVRPALPPRRRERRRPSLG